MVYYASFIPGMQEVIAALLRKRLGDVVIQKLMDGAVIFKTECSYDRLNFFCFNNIFALLDVLELPDSGGLKSEVLETHIRKILFLKKKTWPLISENSGKIKSFRLVFSIENVPSAVNEKLKKDLEKYIQGISSLQLSRDNADTEFWFLFRREGGHSNKNGFSCFLKRLTNHRTTKGRTEPSKSLHQGELSPQLAWHLCHIADLKHGEIVMDPFCGYGSIPNAACKHFPVKEFFASDRDPRCIKISQAKIGLRNAGCRIREADFRSVLNFAAPGSFDAVVTDPPWGMFSSAGSLQTLYDEMMDVFSKALKDDGRAVILSAAQKEMETALEKTRAFQINKTIPILVSGKKATVFVLGRNEG